MRMQSLLLAVTLLAAPLTAQTKPTPAKAAPCDPGAVLLAAQPIYGVGAATYASACPGFAAAIDRWYVLAADSVKSWTPLDVARFIAHGVKPSAPPTVVPIVSQDVDEPAFDSTRQVLLRRDEMEYATFAEAVKGGWRCSNRTTTQDVTTSNLGACQTIADGYTGRALRLAYDGKDNTNANQEAHAWSIPMPDQLAAKAGHALYVSYWFRVVPSVTPWTDDDSHRVQVKWIELWKSDESNRAQFSTAYSFCTNGIPNSAWDFFPQGGQVSKCQSGQVRPPFAKDAPGQWHRLTHKYVTRSSSTAQDGVAQLWFDGTLIVSVDKSRCGTAVPGNVGARAQNWCEDADLNGFFVNDFVKSITFGSVMTGIPLWAFSIDYDRLLMWRD